MATPTHNHLDRISQILDRLSTIESQLSSLSKVIPQRAALQPTDLARPPVYSLRVSDVCERWFTKRFFPDFTVEMVDPYGKVVAPPPSFNLTVRLLSGHDLELHDCLATQTPLSVSFMNGKATVSGIKFSSVSSRHGGFFRFEVSCPGMVGVQPAKTGKVRILSERLKNEQKVDSLLDLKTSDPITRVPGIGKRYAQKLAEQGIVTVRDLALVDASPSNRSRRLELLAAVRKDRGALTEAKLVELLRDARSVLKRDEGIVADSVTTTSVPEVPVDASAPQGKWLSVDGPVESPPLFSAKTLATDLAPFAMPLEDEDLSLFNLENVGFGFEV